MTDDRTRFLLSGLLSPENFPHPDDKLNVFVELFNVAFETRFSHLSMNNIVGRILRQPKDQNDWYTHPVIALPTHVKVDVPNLRQGAAVAVTFSHIAPSKPYTLMLVCDVGQPVVVRTWLHSAELAAFIQQSAKAGALEEA